MIKWNKFLDIYSPKDHKLLLWFSGAFLFLGFFLKLTSELLEHKKILSIDVPILIFISDHIRTPALNGTAVDVTALGSPILISLFTIIALVGLLVKKDKVGALFLALNVIGATLWMAVLKNIIGRSRPNVIPRLIEVTGLSYPSGHSLVSTATYLSLALLICRHIDSRSLITTILSFTGLIILMIAFSRLYLGVHYPSDVFSGVLFGISWVLWLTAIFKTYLRPKKLNSLR